MPPGRRLSSLPNHVLSPSCHASLTPAPFNNSYSSRCPAHLGRGGRGHKRATIAIAHKMPRVICAVLTSRNPYRDPETDYEAPMVKQNAERWIRMLTKHGIDPTTGEIGEPVHA